MQMHKKNVLYLIFTSYQNNDKTKKKDNKSITYLFIVFSTTETGAV